MKYWTDGVLRTIPFSLYHSNSIQEKHLKKPDNLPQVGDKVKQYTDLHAVDSVGAVKEVSGSVRDNGLRPAGPVTPAQTYPAKYVWGNKTLWHYWRPVV